MRFLGLLLFGVAFACTQGNSSGEGMISKEKSLALEDVPVTEQLNEEYTESNNDGLFETEQKIIKTAHLRFETKDPEATHDKILTLTTENKGFVQNDHSGKDNGRIN